LQFVPVTSSRELEKKAAKLGVGFGDVSELDKASHLRSTLLILSGSIQIRRGANKSMRCL
jgi:hypothetical protein